jgi:hypothetical protein
MKTLKHVVTTLKDILSTNELFNECREGNIWEFDTKTVKYPVTWIDVESNPHSIQKSSIQYTFDIYFIDLVYNDESNELNIKSDTMEAAIDFSMFLKNNLEALDFYVMDNFYSAQSFTEQWTDKVSGTKLTINITIKGAGSICKNIYRIP